MEESKNNITLTAFDDESHNYTEFKQTEFGFQFIVNGKEFLRIQNDGQCFKEGQGVVYDFEIFNGLKSFIEHFKKVL